MHRTFQFAICFSLLTVGGCQHNRVQTNAHVQQGHMNPVYAQTAPTAPYPQFANTNPVVVGQRPQVAATPQKLDPIPAIPAAEEEFELPVAETVLPSPSL